MITQALLIGYGMRGPVLTTLATILLVSCTTNRLPSEPAGPPPSSEPNSAPKPLYLHLLSGGETPGGPSRRIASTRVYLFQDFSVSFGPPSNPFTNQYDGAITLPIIDQNGVAAKRPLEGVWFSGDAVLAGRIDQQKGNFLPKFKLA